jgi:hypothetical protein
MLQFITRRLDLLYIFRATEQICLQDASSGTTSVTRAYLVRMTNDVGRVKIIIFTTPKCLTF